MEFAWTGTVVYGIHTVAVKEGTIELEPVVERQPSEWEFVAFRSNHRPRATFLSYLFVPLL